MIYEKRKKDDNQSGNSTIWGVVGSEICAGDYPTLDVCCDGANVEQK